MGCTRQTGLIHKGSNPQPTAPKGSAAVALGPGTTTHPGGPAEPPRPEGTRPAKGGAKGNRGNLDDFNVSADGCVRHTLSTHTLFTI